MLTISAWWSATKPRSFSAATGSGTMVTNERSRSDSPGVERSQPNQPRGGASCRPCRMPVPELDYQVATTVFGLQQCAVGAPQKRLGSIAGLDLGNTEAGGHAAMIQCRLLCRCQVSTDVFGTACGGGVVAIGTQDDKLFTAITGNQIGAAGVSLQMGCKRD